jgi:hypothetical protein
MRPSFLTPMWTSSPGARAGRGRPRRWSGRYGPGGSSHGEPAPQRRWSEAWPGGSRADGDPGGGAAERLAPDAPGRPGAHGGTDAAARTVSQPSWALRLIAGQPLVGRGARHPRALGRLSGGPAQLGDALDQQQPTKLGQASITMAMRVPLPARGFDNPSRPRGPSTVNNPPGNYTSCCVPEVA